MRLKKTVALYCFITIFSSVALCSAASAQKNHHNLSKSVVNSLKNLIAGLTDYGLLLDLKQEKVLRKNHYYLVKHYLPKGQKFNHHNIAVRGKPSEAFIKLLQNFEKSHRVGMQHLAIIANIIPNLIIDRDTIEAVLPILKSKKLHYILYFCEFCRAIKLEWVNRHAIISIIKFLDVLTAAHRK